DRRPVRRGQGVPRRISGDRGAGLGRRAGMGRPGSPDHHPADRGTPVPGRPDLAGKVIAIGKTDHRELENVFRSEYGRAVSVLARDLGDLDRAEEAVQDAFTAAVRHWPRAGIPPQPAGWIITTARRKAIDRWRREASQRDRYARAAQWSLPAETTDIVGDAAS